MRSSRSKAQSLQQAASTIFVLMGLLPFLIFVYLVVMLNGMQNWRVQLGLGIALAFSLLGFSVLVSTMRMPASASSKLTTWTRATGGRRAPSRTAAL